MRKVAVLLILALAVLVARAISQEIVIEPTNGRAQSSNRVSRPAPVEQTPAESKKPAPKVSGGRKAAKQSSAKQIQPPAPSQTRPAAPAMATDEVQPVTPKAKKLPARPEWAMNDTRDAHSLQIEIANALARDPKLTGSSFQVRVDEDSVTVEGRAAGSEERLQAQRLAQSYAWNRKLVDRIEVVSKVTAQK
jgi:hypothetical protein